MLPMSRRAVLAGLASTGALALSGCAHAAGARAHALQPCAAVQVRSAGSADLEAMVL